MGFFGFFLLARTDGPVVELESVKAIGPFDHSSEWTLTQGWRLSQILYSHDWYDPELLARALADETMAPALAMYVYDSGWADVTVDSPGSVHHNFLMNPDVGEIESDRDEPAPAIDDTAYYLKQWAGDAGLKASRRKLTEAIPRWPGPFGEGVDALVKALGLKDSPPAD